MRMHNHSRDRTLKLFGTLKHLDGKIFSTKTTKHNRVKWSVFIKNGDLQTLNTPTLHRFIENYPNHKHTAVRALQ